MSALYDANVRRGWLIVQCPLHWRGGQWVHAVTGAPETPLSEPVPRHIETTTPRKAEK